VIGKGGAWLREVGTAARTQIEKLLGTRIYLDLRVKVPRTGSATQNSLAGLGF
jgi:GTPase